MIIDARQPREDAMVRACCAETGGHDVVHGIGCSACATNLAIKRTGLGFDTLIWC